MSTPPTNQGVLRKEEILLAAVRVAEREGYMVMKRNDVSDEAGCATGSVHRYFVTIEELRERVLEYGVDNRNLAILAQGLAMRHPYTANAPIHTRKSAVLSLLR